MARKAPSTGLPAATRCIWVVSPTLLQTSGSCDALLAEHPGRPKPPLDSRPPAAPAAPAGTTPLPAEAAWYNQRPPTALAVGQTHSWLFVPPLHAAVGRLHSDALDAWQAHPDFAPIWQRSPVEPAALVHALHTLQQLATEEGRALPVVEAQILLALAAESNALPQNTLVHLPWAWQLAALPDGYIPATVQEALLHVFMGEREASELLRAVDALTRPGPPAPPPPTCPQAEHPTVNAGGAPEQQDPPEHSSSSSSSSSSASSSSEAGEGPAARQVHGEFDTLQGPQLRAALASLDPVSVEDVLLQPCQMFRTPPAFCKPQLRRALRWVLRLIRDATGLAPRQPHSLPLLWSAHGSCGFQHFSGGSGNPCSELLSLKRGHRPALTAEPPAAPTEATLRELTDPARRPAEPYRPLPQDLLEAAPNAPIALDRPALLANLRRARRAAAPGPSGYTSEVLRLVLDEEEASQLFCEVASLLARAQALPWGASSPSASLAEGREGWSLVTRYDDS
ncbi:unnamed protein product [Symbiodinium sp. CCMP2456]|nr:unnamed protein product [Symbiodinium sp. CCMP2456]